MIALDTNIILRLFVQDDPAQTEQVVSWLEQNSGPHFVSDIVLVEAFWTLKRLYKFTHKDIASAFIEMMSQTLFTFQRGDQAMHDIFQTVVGKGLDLSDVLLADCAQAMGCTATVTFDQAAIKAGLMTSLDTK